MTGKTRDSDSRGLGVRVDLDWLLWSEPQDRRKAGRAELRELPRKEVIQPQVPLRLPCYDFTPITNHTVGVCPLVKRLAQRLLVQSTFRV